MEKSFESKEVAVMQASLFMKYFVGLNKQVCCEFRPANGYVMLHVYLEVGENLKLPAGYFASGEERYSMCVPDTNDKFDAITYFFEW